MSIFKSRINDYKQTIERLQKECTEKTTFSIQLIKRNIQLMIYINELKEKQKKYKKYEQALNEIYLIIDEIKEQYDVLEIGELELIKDIISKAKENKQ